MPALLILAQSATDALTVAAMQRMGAAIHASPIVVAIPADIEAVQGARVVRVKRDGAPITALRIGMAQLTNTTATSVLLWPLAAAEVAMPTLLALLDAAERAPGVITALSDVPIDRSPLVVPRDAWLELVTLGEGGLDALTTRRRTVRVDGASGRETS